MSQNTTTPSAKNVVDPVSLAPYPKCEGCGSVQRPCFCKTAHTAGPWKVIGTTIFGSEGNASIADLNKVSSCIWEDARLIVAAPEMKDKLEAMRDYLVTFFEDYEKLPHDVKKSISHTCPIRRLESSIEEISILLTKAYGTYKEKEIKVEDLPF